MKGRKHNESSKLAISCAGKGELNGMFGRVHTNEARTKMSLAVRQNHPKAKPVIDTVSGQTFKSAREAARQTGINANTLKAWLSGRFANQSSLRYT
jgi:hypothetical protein